VRQADLVSALGPSDLAQNFYGADVQRGGTEGEGAIGCHEVISTIDAPERLERPWTAFGGLHREERLMPIKVLELHHHGIRIGKTSEEIEQARQFYNEVLGLPVDTGRPTIPGIPGFWMYVGDDAHTAQIHLMGAVGRSPMARSDIEDPTIPHVALAVEDIQEAQKELDQRGIWYWRIQGLVGQYSDQVFVRDPFGNVIELHQIGTCRCNKAALKE
jgi:catechol 2,3-dioxygenase-like lactoylglutathione lyase family enzyme